MPLNFSDSDYSTLARLQQPQMMPNAPIGAGGMAGMMYFQDKANREGTLQKLSEIADIDAQNKRQGSEEYMAGAPGRLSEIGLKNVMAAGALSNAPDALEMQTNQSKAGVSASRQQKMEAILSESAPWAQTWKQAKDKSDKDSVREMMKANGVNQIGGKNIDDIPDEKMDRLMDMSFQRQVNTPKAVAAQQLEQVRGTNQLNKAELQGQYKVLEQVIRGQDAQKRAEIRAKSQETIKGIVNTKPESMGQLKASLYRKVYQSRDATDLERQMLDDILHMELAKDMANAANKPGVPNPDALKEGAPKETPILKTPVQPKVPPLPKKQADELKVGGVYNGKKVMKESEDGRFFLLDDNTVVEKK